MPPVPHRAVTVTTAKRGKRPAPMRILIYGPPGVGKTTFVCDADGSILIDLQDGAPEIDTPRLLDPDDRPLRTWEQVSEGLESLIRDPHPYRRVAIDDIGKCEEFIYAHVNNRGADKKNSIEDWGYGKGYQMALDVWREFLRKLDELRYRRNMDIIFTGHSLVKTFRNPSGEDYDRFMPAVHEKVAGALIGWCEMVGFAQFETLANKAKGALKAKGQWNGRRTLSFMRQAGFEAKYRYNLTQTMPFNWNEFQHRLISGRKNELPELTARLAALIAEFRKVGGNAEVAEAAEKNLRDPEVAADPTRLLKGIDYLQALIAELNTENEGETNAAAS